MCEVRFIEIYSSNKRYRCCDSTGSRSDRSLDDVKIILLTAKGQACDRAVGKEAGANDYMTKPFSPSKILDRAREILGD